MLASTTRSSKMDDLTQLKIVDIYTGKIVRASGRGDLKEWLTNSYKTLTEQQQSMIDCLDTVLKLDDEFGIKWPKTGPDTDGIGDSVLCIRSKPTQRRQLPAEDRAGADGGAVRHPVAVS